MGHIPAFCGPPSPAPRAQAGPLGRLWAESVAVTLRPGVTVRSSGSSGRVCRHYVSVRNLQIHRRSQICFQTTSAGTLCPPCVPHSVAPLPSWHLRLSSGSLVSQPRRLTDSRPGPAASALPDPAWRALAAPPGHLSAWVLDQSHPHSPSPGPTCPAALLIPLEHPMPLQCIQYPMTLSFSLRWWAVVPGCSVQTGRHRGLVLLPRTQSRSPTGLPASPAH